MTKDTLPVCHPNARGLFGLVQRKKQVSHGRTIDNSNNRFPKKHNIQLNNNNIKNASDSLSGGKEKHTYMSRTQLLWRLLAFTMIIIGLLGIAFSAVDNKRYLLLRMAVYPWQAVLIDPVAPVDYAVVDLPDEIHQMLLDHLNNMEIKRFQSNQPVFNGPVELHTLLWDQKQRTIDGMRPLMEKFCHCELEPHAVIHGIRLYQNTSVLLEHIDWPDSWVVSATINIRNLNGSMWPLTLRNGIQWWTGQPSASITHQPGQAVLYQGSRIWHSRPEPYNGEEYAAVFIGYLPKGYPDGAGWTTRFILWGLQEFKKARLL